MEDSEQDHDHEYDCVEMLSESGIKLYSWNFRNKQRRTI